ncbi:cysteine desulfurase [Pseudomonas borbori]|uniref:Cysteine desulfurase n=1 Tax=Pseudomonas borbori TaxID=289003 RepID=A0A1I5QQ09_9PSED|nr:cysteine desulfurase [Pseudomonas borbori]SFP48157.1 cysteine desulfurase /L-selenocysteine selenide-lyase (L-alanine-forming) [Pseudomonas borbori]
MSERESSLQPLVQRFEPYQVERLRQAFPILAQRIYGKPLVYLDSAATSQKPQAVIDAMSRFFLEENANVHRGVHYLSLRATEAYEQTRAKVQRFLNAAHAEEIVFVRGTTEAVNLVAQTYGKVHVHAGDEVLISAMEHHSNIVPWQMLCEQSGARLRVAPIDDAGELQLDELERLIGPRTKLLAISHVSNVLGTVNPIQSIVELAHAQGAPVLVDGAQAAPHLQLDVRALGCDFYALSGHKMYGPTGIGALYGRRELLEAMPPYQGGGDMILSVSFDKTLYNKPPYRFEAGTPNMVGAIGLGAAIDFLGGLDADALAAHEQAVLAYAQEALATVPGLRLIGTARDKIGVLSFVLDGIHPHDIGTILDREGIAIRTGHHCAQPLMQRYGLAATARASLGCYSNEQDIDALLAGLAKVQEVFR